MISLHDMSSGHFAAYSAIGTSVVSLLAVIVFVPAIFMKVVSVQEMLRLDGDEFRILADDAWKEIMVAKSAPGSAEKRHKRQQFGFGRAICRKF